MTRKRVVLRRTSAVVRFTFIVARDRAQHEEGVEGRDRHATYDYVPDARGGAADRRVRLDRGASRWTTRWNRHSRPGYPRRAAETSTRSAGGGSSARSWSRSALAACVRARHAVRRGDRPQLTATSLLDTSAGTSSARSPRPSRATRSSRPHWLASEIGARSHGPLGVTRTSARRRSGLARADAIRRRRRIRPLQFRRGGRAIDHDGSDSGPRNRGT